MVLPNYAPPVAACAINEIVGSITWANFSHLPVLILPLITKTLNADHEVAHRAKSAEAITIYGAQIGDANNSADTLVSGLAVPPPSFQIRSEPLACLVQVVRVSKLPTVLLIAPSSEQQSKGSADRELEVRLKFSVMVEASFFFFGFGSSAMCTLECVPVYHR